jgi:hypothetical protein
MIDDILKDIDKSNLSIIRIMMLEIRNRIDEPVEINESTVKSLYLNLITKNYGTIMMYHGEAFIASIMELYAEYELYEICAIIKSSINNVNKIKSNA